MLAQWRTAIALAGLLLAQAPAPPVTSDAYAVRFGILAGFQVSSLVYGADRSRTPGIVRIR